MYSIILLASLLFLNPVLLFSQDKHVTNIYGTVVEKKSGAPVSSANVYISGTMAGTTTNDDGEFEFKTDFQGKYELIFSYIGYETITKPVLLQSNQDFLLVNVEMNKKTFEFEELVVESDNREWQKNYEVFTEQFIGTTSNARETFIQNSWVLDFTFDENGALIARASEPLLIVNHALGYKMHVDLMNFKWRKNIDLALFKMKVKYTEMEPESRNMLKKWENNRTRTYEGSFGHFLFSLYEDELRSNSFEVKPLNGIKSLSAGETRLRLMESGQSYSGRQRLLKGYSISKIVEILYGSKSSMRDIRKTSLIAPMASERGYFFITENRNLLDPLSLRVDGIWGLHRVADMVPREFYTD